MKSIRLTPTTEQFVLSIFVFLSSVLTVNAQCTPAPVVSTAVNTAPAGGTFAMSGSGAGIVIYNSAETGGNSAAVRQTVDTYDDAWRAGSRAAEGRSISEPWRGDTTAGTIPNGTTLFTFAGTSVSVSLQDMPTNLETATHDCDGTATASAPSNSVSDTLQDDAPRPAQLYNTAAQPGFWNETNLGSTSSRNAVLFTFSTTVKSFGAWFGDVETRTDGQGRPSIIRLLDENGNRIGEDVLLDTSTPSAQQGDCDSTVSGGEPDAAPGCGSETTRWIGFVDTNSTLSVRAVLVIVGDADDTVGTWTGDPEGYTEHISFIGATIAKVPTAASAEVSGRIVRPNGKGIYNAQVQVLNVATGQARFARTTPNGNFAFYDLLVGDSYILTVTDKRYSFPNSTQAFQLFASRDDIIFVSN